MLNRILPMAVSAVAIAALAACGSSSSTTGGGATAAGGGGDKPLVMGFSQVGAESGWRTANTKNIQESAKTASVELKFSDAQQKQENQIKAIRSYIQQKVDVIAFSPVVETGWDTVLL
ncbi:MAG: periplasmic binding protein/LacI transcriptional regulator, partial [Humibacillus sp.]|nr:periplasmic binding protein/LacI transcriptional regulator [Humibacillus sp.]